jgi:hypothetical protein
MGRFQGPPALKRHRAGDTDTGMVQATDENPSTGPALRIPAPQLTREWSLWPEFGRIPGNLCDLSKR